MIEIVKNNIWLTRGDAAYLRLNVKVKETGQPFDYSNCLTRLTVKKNAISNTVIFQKTFLTVESRSIRKTLSTWTIRP